METQAPQIGIPPVPATEQTSVANELLANARLIRDQLNLESADVNRKLSEAILTAIMYTEKAETITRLLALADTSVGKIRSRMRAHGIPIQPPSTPSDGVTSVPDVNRNVIQGWSLCSHYPDSCVLMRC